MDTYDVPPTVYKYHDPGRLTSWLRVAAFAVVAVGAIMLALNIVDWIAAPHGAPTGVAQAIARIFGGILLFASAAYFGLFFFWLFRATANVHALGADVSFAPGWAVGWFIVPIVDLWMSFLVVEELWRASADARDWRRQLAPWLVIHWWAISVAAFVVAFLLRFLIGGGLLGHVAWIIFLGGLIWMAYRFIAISERVCTMQQAQAAPLAFG